MPDIDLEAFSQPMFDTMIRAGNNGFIPPMVFAYRESGNIRTESLSSDIAPLLSSGMFKGTLFDFWRRMCADPAVDIFACACEMWGFRLNKAGDDFQAENPQGYRAMLDHDFVKLSAAGYGEVYEAVSVVTQSRERVRFMQRRFIRKDGILIWHEEPPVSEEVPQSGFRGRQKMWGDLRVENLS